SACGEPFRQRHGNVGGACGRIDDDRSPAQLGGDLIDNALRNVRSRQAQDHAFALSPQGRGVPKGLASHTRQGLPLFGPDIVTRDTVAGFEQAFRKRRADQTDSDDSDARHPQVLWPKTPGAVDPEIRETLVRLRAASTTAGAVRSMNSCRPQAI